MILLLATSTVHGQGQISKMTLMHDDIEREYNLYLPSTHTGEVESPLVISMHGASGTPDFQMASTGLNRIAEREGFIAVYPGAAPGGDWDGPEDNVGFGDNVGFIDNLIGVIDEDYNVNDLRVYATGVSQGGFMSYVLAENLPHRIAAVASVAFTGVPGSVNRPFPVLSMHGTGDVVAPFNGGTVNIPGVGDVEFAPVTESIDAWVANNSCDAVPMETSLPNVFARDGSSVTRLTYQGCSTYTSVSGNDISADYVFYRVDGGGHNWPVSEDYRSEALTETNDFFGDLAPFLLPLNSDIDAGAEIWNFFEQHELAIPEPSCLSLATLPLVGLLHIARRRRC